MTLKEKLIDLTAEDGPNIPMSTIAIYCGVSPSLLSKYLLGKRNLSVNTESQVQKGLKEMAQLIYNIANED